MKKIYGLTDGSEIFEVRPMTYAQWCDVRRSARNITGGNINWELLSDTPISATFKIRAPKEK